MVNNKNKKAGMELSLNLIIMLVIGLVVLGLVIGFVTGFLGDAEKKFNIGEDDKNQLDQVKNEDGNFVVTPRTLAVKKGDKAPSKLFAKVRNSGDSSLSLEGLEDGALTESSTLSVSLSGGKGAGTEITDLKLYMPPFSLEPGQEDAYPIEVEAGSTVKTGTYYAKLILKISDSEKFTQIVTLNVE